MPIDKVEKELRREFERERMLKRIKANTITVVTGFRDHFCTHPGRHSWDICGHPLYYWSLKAILGSKYVQKLFLSTEVEEVLEMGTKMSDKFVPMGRTLKACKEPMSVIIDDLKTPSSRKGRVPVEFMDAVKKKEKELFGDEVEPVRVAPMICYPLVTSESIDRLIEAYFSDPFVDKAQLVYKCCHSLYMKDPTSEYFMDVAPFAHSFGRRQQGFQMYHSAGSFMPYFPKYSQGRTVCVEVPIDEGFEVGDEEELRIARIFMKARLEKKRAEKEKAYSLEGK